MVANRIYEIMDQKHMKQSLVAKAAGFKPSMFNDMLRGRKTIKAEFLPAISAALGVTPNDLFSDDPKEEAG